MLDCEPLATHDGQKGQKTRDFDIIYITNIKKWLKNVLFVNLMTKQLFLSLFYYFYQYYYLFYCLYYPLCPK